MVTPPSPAKAGDRIKLVRCTDPYTALGPGMLGTVTLVDGLGTIHVDWDNGIQLGLIDGEDLYIVLAGRRRPEPGAGLGRAGHGHQPRS